MKPAILPTLACMLLAFVSQSACKREYPKASHPQEVPSSGVRQGAKDNYPKATTGYSVTTAVERYEKEGVAISTTVSRGLSDSDDTFGRVQFEILSPIQSSIESSVISEKPFAVIHFSGVCRYHWKIRDGSVFVTNDMDKNTDEIENTIEIMIPDRKEQR